MSLSDAREFSLGNSVQENILVSPGTLLSGSSTNGLVLHPRNYAKYSSTLLGFEYHAGTTGTLTIFVSVYRLCYYSVTRGLEIPCRTCRTWSHFIQDK